MPAPMLVCATNGFVTGTWNNIVIHVQRNIGGVDAVDALERATKVAEGTQADKIVFLVIIERTSAPPEPSARKALLRLFNTSRAKTSGYYAVAEGGSFQAAAVRAVALALSVLAPKSFPFLIEQTVRDVAERIERDKRTSSAIELEVAVNRLRLNFVPNDRGYPR